MVDPEDIAVLFGFGPSRAFNVPQFTREGVCVSTKSAAAERRKWPRLPLAIPIFVRSQVDQNREFLEFATALNVSAGGMLVAVRRALPAHTEVSLEIPSAPLAAFASAPAVARNLSGKILRTERAESYHLIALKFSRPIVSSRPKFKLQLRKQVSAL